MDIPVSVISLADICIRYGTILVNTCKTYKNADQEIRETILMIEARWLKIQHQLELLRDIWPTLDEDYQIHQNTVLQVLHGKSQAAISLIDSVVGKRGEEPSINKLVAKRGESRSVKFAVFGKASLKSVLNDLKEWSEVFDMSWYLIIRLANRQLDQQLKPIAAGDSEPLSTFKSLREAIHSNLRTQAEAEKENVLLPPTFFTTTHYTPLEAGFSSSGIWTNVDGCTQYLIDQPSNLSTWPDICKLAKVLKKVEPFLFGILACKGVVKVPTDSLSTLKLASQDADLHSRANPGIPAPSSRFLFKIPPNLTKPKYLRTLLLTDTSKRQTYSLDDRFSLARQLAKSVMFVHSAGFVHKSSKDIQLTQSFIPYLQDMLPSYHVLLSHPNVTSFTQSALRPETVLIFEDENSTDLWAFLTGFGNFRLADGNTIYQGDENWARNLYRHPTRQGFHPEEVYSMQHDIYSLGVCLLEIGMGSSFVLWEPDNGDAKPNNSIASEVDSMIKDRRRKAFAIKEALIRLTHDELPFKMGRKYSKTVATCLTCLDKSNNAFGDESEFLDENGILVGVRFIEKILTTLLSLKI